MWNKRRCLRTESESLPHEVVEYIMERLPAKSLLRFKAVSKQWKSTIESSFFKGRQLIHGQSSGDPEVFMMCYHPHRVKSLRTLVVGSSSQVEIPVPREMKNIPYLVCRSSCDGLVCLYDRWFPGFVVNPTTGWYRTLPLCDLQRLRVRLGDSYYTLGHTISDLGFGKDKLTGTYKAVWLYNSAEIGLENATTCEVFDFCSNAWSYVTPAAPYRIAGFSCHLQSSVCQCRGFSDGHVQPREPLVRIRGEAVV
ncbi:unnamed protein product [Thlaspi arvense]|uniref:F-box domain-containing protein n=1 Tax=Thlaspi arvense TaxID=13288 RepID=A0AAU9RBT3_THLAR|nr:unnamed protein product [Thlaspi arvense]